MSISRRGKSWQVSVSHGGKRIRKSFHDLSEAKIFESESLTSLLTGKHQAEEAKESESIPSVTFGGLAERIWKLEWSKQKSAAHTRKRLAAVCKHFGADTPVSSITSYTLETYIFNLQDLGNGPATINRKLSIVGKIMNYAHRHGVIQVKPVAPLQREPRGRIRYYTEEEESKILECMESTDLQDFFAVLLDTGMRKGEALSLEWQDVDCAASLITLADPDKIKASLPRTVPMTRRVCEIMLSRDRSKASPFDFTADMADHMVRDFKKESGYEGETSALFHTCRHTFCSRLLQRGVPLTTVKELAGHKNIKTTLRYAHLAPSNFVDAVAKLETA